MQPIETRQRNGYTVELHYDEDGEGANPRDNDGNFLFLGFPHRSYKIGDEEIDPGDPFPCAECDGTGCQGTGMPDDCDDCPACEGSGEVYADGLAELIDLVKIKYKANLVLPVGMIDHSGVAYYIGGGPHWSDTAGWDSGTCGLILDTPEALAERMGPDFVPTVEWLTEAFTAEIDEYSKWANGEVYGFVIKDINGDVVDSCSGFLGHECAWGEAEATADCLLPQPPRLYDSPRLTKAEIDRLIGALRCLHGGEAIDAIAAKFEDIDTEEDG